MCCIMSFVVTWVRRGQRRLKVSVRWASVIMRVCQQCSLSSWIIIEQLCYWICMKHFAGQGTGTLRKLFPPRIRSSSLPLHVTCVISSQSSLLDPFNHPHWSLFFNHQLTPVSRSQTAPSGMPHLTCGTHFLLLFVFLISSILHHHPALLHHHALILDRFDISHDIFLSHPKPFLFLTVFPSIAIYPFLGLIPGIMTTLCLAVTGGGSIGKCGGLSHPIWLLLRTVI